MKYVLFITCIIVLFFASCKKNIVTETTVAPPVTEAGLYFPPVNSAEWQTTLPASLGWKEAALNDVYTYLQQKNTKAFIILKDGKIVTEKYFGSFTADSLWYWASAGKSMTAFLVGLAQQEGSLSINNPTSDYLGNGWTTCPPNKEALITVRNQDRKSVV